MSGPTIWDTCMFLDEADMFDCRLEAFEGRDAVHVVTESRFTHRSVPKPLSFPADLDLGYPICHLVDDFEPDPAAPWVNEHAQRNYAWRVIDAEAADDDVVLICDVDEIPSPQLLDFLPLWATAAGEHPLSVRMKTYLFAVDWQVPDPLPLPGGRREPLPPTCVVATVRCLRKRAASGEYLAEVRDGRSGYPEFSGFGGWHFSWCGGPERQREKLETSTCHTEILSTPEADLIRSGARWRSPENGGGLPVVPVEVDESWPAYVFERRCPPEWFRAREAAA